MLKQRFVLVMLVILAGVFVVGAQDAVRIGDTISGELAAGEVLEYQLEAKAGDRLLLSLSSEAFDTVLSVIGTDGFELARDDDGGEDTNSILRGLEIPEDGVYTIRVESFDGNTGGAFTLTVNRFEAISINLGDTTPVSVSSGMEAVYFAYEASSGDVVDIVVDSGNTLDTRIEVISPFGFVVIANDDAAGSVDPELRQIVLDSDGTYYVALSPAKANAALEGEVQLSLLVAELPTLDDGPVEMVFGNDDLFRKAVTFEGAAGETVRLTTDIDAEANWVSAFVTIQQGTEEVARFNHSGIQATTVEFEIPAAGTVTIIVEAYSTITLNIALGRGID